MNEKVLFYHMPIDLTHTHTPVFIDKDTTYLQAYLQIRKKDVNFITYVYCATICTGSAVYR